MSTRPPKQITRSNKDALAAFVSRKAAIDTMLARLLVLSENHFGYSPDEVTWAHVGTLEQLRRSSRARHGHGVQRGRRRDIALP
jgi:hypothetical protein